MSAPNCVDMSRWGGELIADEAACMKAAGIGTVIVASGPGNYGLFARQQAEAALAAGLRLEAYTFLEFESDPEWWVRQSLARLEGLPVARWWLDVEDTDHGKSWTPAQRIAYVQRALDAFAAAGVFAHVYSGGWYWLPYMGNTDAFARQGRKLWNSWYDGDPDVDGLPYGMDDGGCRHRGPTTRRPARGWGKRGGRLRCLECGSAMVGQTLKGRFRYYRCRRAFFGPRHDRCDSRYVRGDAVETTILEEAASLLSRPEVVYAQLQKQTTVPARDRDDGAIQQRLDGLAKQRERILRLFQIGEVDEEYVARESAAIRAEQERLQAKVAPVAATDAPLPERATLDQACGPGCSRWGRPRSTSWPKRSS